MELRPGYKQTEVGVLPEDWEVETVDKLAFVTSGKRLPAGYSLVDHPTPYPYVRVTDMRPGTVSLSEIQFVPEAAFEAIKKYRIFSQDLFISVAGTLGIIGVVPPELDGANLTENADRITDIKCSQKYLMYVLMSPLIQNQIESIRTVGAQPKLALARIRKFEIPVPQPSEQVNVAEALSDADTLIESLESLIAKKRAIKLGVMQELLSERRRLPGYKGDWSSVPLGNLGRWVGGGTPSMARVDYWTNGTIPWASSADIRLGEMTGELRRVTERAISESSARLVPKNSVVVVTRSGILRRFLPVCLLTEPVAINQDIKALIPNKPSIGGFVTQSLIYHNEAILVSCLKSGTTVESIELDWLKKYEIHIPRTDDEIQKVCAVLDEFDADIRALERKVYKTRQIKQGMMQGLLTGRIRLV